MTVASTLRDHADAVDDDLVDGQHQPDHQAAAHLAQRDGLRELPSGRLDPRRQPAAPPSTACPQGVINITLDGINIQDNTNRSTDGFFAIVSPRLDAIEEVSVTTAGQGADAGQGAVQIKFTTRSGSNNYTGSGYWYYRSDDLNANTWFNNRAEHAEARS